MLERSPERLRAEQVMESLQPFQRATVEHVVNRLWKDPDAVDRFLVADEVGLGKTMVAKGVIARAVEHLAGSEDRIDVVYICSNSQIARQNLSRLNVVDGYELSHADRLTLLPTVMRDLTSNSVNFVSFTPGTSFNVTSSAGRWEERRMLYWMLRMAWGSERMNRNYWKQFFRGGVARENFDRRLESFDRLSVDKETSEAFATAVAAESGPRGARLEDELEACALRYRWMRGDPPADLRWQTNELIGALRELIAHVSVDRLEPDLVIFDEFQRFKDVLDGDDAGARLARRLYSAPTTRTLLLSATPYKMYTLPDEPDGEDHHTDFLRTIQFLAPARVGRVSSGLDTMRRVLLGQADPAVGRAARDAVEQELRRVMSRTERAGVGADAMLVDREGRDLRVTVEDLRRYRALSQVSRAAGSYDVFELWRSTPYLFNLMDTGSYQVLSKLEAAAERGDTGLTELLRPEVLLSPDDIRSYRRLDSANAKMRSLVSDVMNAGAWRLAWLPPSMPYYELSEEYADSVGFTKRLIFSAWAIVPKAISVLVSYEAERRTVEASGYISRGYDRQFRTRVFAFPPPREDAAGHVRYPGMAPLSVLYPSTTLARLGDPLTLAREAGSMLSIDDVVARVRESIASALADLSPGVESAAVDQRWYWAAPFLLDRHREHDDIWGRLSRWHSDARKGREAEAAEQSGHADHIAHARSLDPAGLGRRPEDLADVLARVAVAGPGVAALRALSRVCGGPPSLEDPVVREHAYRVAHGIGAMFNKPEIALLLRAGEEETGWREAVDHCLRGGLQAVLDEYAHVLIGSEGLQDAESHERAERLADAMLEALGARSAVNRVRKIDVVGGRVEMTDDQRVRSHLAARYGRTSSDAGEDRETVVRAAYNSPFRPFVLASTSVGQEGLDFHTYSHAIIHWNLPSNPVDLEQREGRVHRYKGHAVRKNVAAAHSVAAFASTDADPWEAAFDAARAEVASTSGSENSGPDGLRPYWVYSGDGGQVPARIERYVPAMPLSKEVAQYERLRRTLAAYRLVMGQPRQEDLVKYIAAAGDGSSGAPDALDWMRIDLTPAPQARKRLGPRPDAS